MRGFGVTPIPHLLILEWMSMWISL